MTGIDDFNKGILAKNADALRAAGIDPTPALPRDMSVETKQDVKDEKALQRLCEAYLTRIGGRRMTVDAVCSAKASGDVPPVWFAHVNRARGNPLFPDLMLINGTGERSLFVELKVRSVWQPGQREFVEVGVWRVVWNVAEFIHLVEEWRGSYGVEC